MAVWQREGPVHVQDVMLCAQEALQVLRVRGHLLGHGVHAPCADQSLGEEQRHAFLLPVHHHLHGTDGRFKTVKGQIQQQPGEVEVSGFIGGSRSFWRTTTLICDCRRPARLASHRAPPVLSQQLRRCISDSLRIRFCELKVNSVKTETINSCELGGKKRKAVKSSSMLEGEKDIRREV